MDSEFRVIKIIFVTIIILGLACFGVNLCIPADAHHEIITPNNDILIVEVEKEVVELIADVIETPEPELSNPTQLSDDEFETLINTCRENSIAPSLCLGLISVESGFVRDIVSKGGSGCYGYCQLNPRYFPSDLSPCENIKAGIEYLAYQINRYDSLDAGLQAYHDGHDTGRRWYANAVLEASTAFYEADIF